MSLTNLIETHSRRAASVCVLPCSTSRTARSRNSTGCGLPIPDPHICLKDTESQDEPHGNPESDQGRHALIYAVRSRADLHHCQPTALPPLLRPSHNRTM